MTATPVRTIPNTIFPMKRLTTIATTEATQLTFPGEFLTNRSAADETRIKVFERIHKLYGGSISKFFNALDKQSLPKADYITVRKNVGR